MRYRVLVEYRGILHSVGQDDDGWFLLNHDEGDDFDFTETPGVIEVITRNVLPFNPEGDIIIRPVT